jgi:hypothetical protein
LTRRKGLAKLILQMGACSNMKPGIQLIAAAVMLLVAAAAPAFAQKTDRSAAADRSPATSNEMSITDSPAQNPIAAPAVTSPSSPADVISTVPHASVPAASNVAPQNPVAQNLAPQTAQPNAMPLPVTTADANSAAATRAPSSTDASGDASDKLHYMGTSPAETPAAANAEASRPASGSEANQRDANKMDGADAASTAEVNGPATADTAPAPTNSAVVKTPASPTDLKESIVAPTVGEAKKDSIATPQQSLAMTAGEVLYNQTHDASTLDPMSWSVSVSKLRHELALYYKGRFFRKYDAVFGRNLDNAPKAYAQDRRTPEGVYTIIKKYQSPRFRWFLRLNYPNNVDRIRYAAMRDDGVVPVGDHGRVTPVGSAIGIHGTDVPILNAGHVNWTTGCISVGNNEIDDLARMLPIGTVVIIQP